MAGYTAFLIYSPFEGTSRLGPLGPHGLTLSTRQISLHATACGYAPFQDVTLRFDAGISPGAGSLLPGSLAHTLVEGTSDESYAKEIGSAQLEAKSNRRSCGQTYVCLSMPGHQAIKMIATCGSQASNAAPSGPTPHFSKRLSDS